MKVKSVDMLMPALVAFDSEPFKIVFLDFAHMEVHGPGLSDEVKKEILEKAMSQQVSITVPEDLKDEAIQTHDEVLHGSKQS